MEILYSSVSKVQFRRGRVKIDGIFCCNIFSIEKIAETKKLSGKKMLQKIYDVITRKMSQKK